MGKHIRNATAFRAVLPSTPALQEHLANFAFTEIREQDYSRLGFVPAPGSGDTSLALDIPGATVFGFRYDEKVVPVTAVNEALSKRVAEIEDLEGRKIGRKERRQIRDNVFADILPRALARTTVVTCYYHRPTGILIVATASQKIADLVLSTVVKAVESVETKTIHINGVVKGLTAKLREFMDGEDSFGGFEPAGDCWLASGSSKVTVKGDSAFRSEVRAAMESGHDVQAITLKHGTSLLLKLTHDFKLKAIDASPELDPDVVGDFTTAAGAEFALVRAALEELLALFGYKPAE